MRHNETQTYRLFLEDARGFRKLSFVSWFPVFLLNSETLFLDCYHKLVLQTQKDLLLFKFYCFEN